MSCLAVSAFVMGLACPSFSQIGGLLRTAWRCTLAIAEYKATQVGQWCKDRIATLPQFVLTISNWALALVFRNAPVVITARRSLGASPSEDITQRMQFWVYLCFEIDEQSETVSIPYCPLFHNHYVAIRFRMRVENFVALSPLENGYILNGAKRQFVFNTMILPLAVPDNEIYTELEDPASQTMEA